MHQTPHETLVRIKKEFVMVDENFYSRYTAAEVLRQLADLGQSGHYPNGLSAMEVGKAIARIACNSSEPQWLENFLKGYGIDSQEERDGLSRVLQDSMA